MPSNFASDEAATDNDLDFEPASSADEPYPNDEHELASEVEPDLDDELEDLDDLEDDGEPNDPVVYPVEFEEGRIDADAAKVVRRLARNGYEAYLVGGCVRDLLVGRSPKDYDVATSARPDDVRRLFRNSRIIGRRFRLVHVLFGGGKVIETATFRRAPEAVAERAGDDLLIKNDNVFGDAHEDATRRDFTINGLFYDIERRVVLDWVGGMPDIERRTVHTIGDPIVRFQEDPVRILRAIKFSARTDFGISPEVYDAMVLCRDALRRAAKPRLFEEVLRLLREGASHRAIWLCWETGVLDILVPELSAYLADRPEDDSSVWRLLSEVDARTRSSQGAPDDIVLVAILLLEPMLEACAGQRDRVDAAWEFMETIVDRLNVPRRIAEPIRRIGAVLPRLQMGRVGRFARTNLYPLAAEVAELYAAAHGDTFTSEEDGSHVATPTAAANAPSRRRRRRRPRG